MTDGRNSRVARHARGARSNPESRYVSTRTEAVDDGWSPPEAQPLETILIPDQTRSIIARNDSPDIPFDRSINPYRGCEHGCTYCFARPSHAWLDMSPGLDFETKILYKPNAAALLEKELAARGYECAPIALGSNTDPYQSAERRLGITRSILEVCRDHRHPVTIVTKSTLVERDRDILEAMAADGLAHVHISVTTLDAGLARSMEPRAAPPARRVGVISALTDAGIPVGVLASPMIPGLNDTELEAILEASAGAGASSAGYILLRLPREVATLFEEWLRDAMPLAAEKVLSLVRKCRDGKISDSTYGRRMRGQGVFADLLEARFHQAVKRLGLGRRPANLDTSLFRIPPRAGDQMNLFG